MRAWPASSPAASIRTPRRAGVSSGCATPGIDVGAPRPARGAAPERGVADVDRARRPHVILKLAVSVDGRVAVPGRALGDRRGVAAARPRAARVGRRRRRRDGHRPRGRAAARRAGRRRRPPAAAARVRPRAAPGRLASSSSAAGPLADELATLAAEGVQSLLLEGGPTIARRVPRDGPRRPAARLRRSRARRRRAADARASSPSRSTSARRRWSGSGRTCCSPGGCARS